MTNQIKGGDVAELSTDISIITAEINAYQRVAGEAIFEIGKRLKHVKERDLAHGEFGKWLKESVNFTDRQARRFIQVAEEFKTDDVVRIGSSKVFELLQLPSEVDRQQFIEQPHTIPSSGETKTVDEMTVRELREVKKALKQVEQERDAERKERERLEKEADKPPKVEYRTEYIKPSDYEQLRQENAELKSKYGVGLQRIDYTKKAELFTEFADDLEYIRNKYASVLVNGQVLREYVEINVDVGDSIDNFDDFWNAFSKSVFKNQNIIEMESV